MNPAKIETKMLRTGGLPCICLRKRLDAIIGLHSLGSSLPFICAGKYPTTRPKLHLSESKVCQSIRSIHVICLTCFGQIQHSADVFSLACQLSVVAVHWRKEEIRDVQCLTCIGADSRIRLDCY